MRMNECMENLIKKGQRHLDPSRLNEEVICDVCKEPKQMKIEFQGQERIVACMCKCERDEQDREKNERNRIIHEHKVMQQRIGGLNRETFAKWNFDNDDSNDSELSNIMKKYVDSFEKFKKEGLGLLLYGDTGTGKTFYACCIANALLDRGNSVLVTNFSTILNAIQNTTNRNDYINALCAYSLLVIDDLGIERRTDFAKEQVYNIIDSRYCSGLPMIITTNLNIQELKAPDDIGYKRIYHRVLERCHPIEVNGTKRRNKKIRDNFENMREVLGV